ncbi:MAG: hypothetical protein BWY07_02019 [Candidatus Hydrogenedentes bacterium ADurb.Bin170]|mgnify:CR=1 FL=1|jgi:hypothetical protein|nr:MAG: hypothetical protein BWY07_02019 [Candidatus Hydrogenedentes bacterium ADurb.Bin170]
MATQIHRPFPPEVSVYHIDIEEDNLPLYIRLPACYPVFYRETGMQYLPGAPLRQHSLICSPEYK